MNVHAYVVRPVDDTLTGVDPDANPHRRSRRPRVFGKPSLDGNRRAHGVRHAAERNEK
jgi:hypothetical protein